MQLHGDLLIFHNETDHLCVWDLAKKKAHCLCSHRFGVRNDAVVVSRDMVYIASPAQIHVISMAEVMDGDATNHNGNGSQSSWRRMGLTVMEQGDGELVADRFPEYNLWNEPRRQREWERWSDCRLEMA